MARIAVVGAGIAGMTAAYRLSARHEVSGQLRTHDGGAYRHNGFHEDAGDRATPRWAGAAGRLAAAS